MSLDSIQILTLCLAAFSAAVNAWVAFKLGTGAFHQEITLLRSPPPPHPSDWGDDFDTTSGDDSHVSEAGTLEEDGILWGGNDSQCGSRLKTAGKFGPAKVVTNDGCSPVGCAPFLKGNLFHCHCQVTQVCNVHRPQWCPSGDWIRVPASNLQPNSVAANHPHRVKNAKRRAKHRQSKC
ncbi:hypothetical protein XFEB_00732 [Xylella fastidiosa EB92.1]|nr:hypothetical protein XFEB_00732 [Xylella fastidiosa EB92.1]